MAGPESPSSEVAASTPVPVARRNPERKIHDRHLDPTEWRSTDSLLRFAMRADAVLTGLAGIAALRSRAGCRVVGDDAAFEYSMSAFFIVYGIAVLGLAALPSGSASRYCRHHRQPAVHGRGGGSRAV
jgi:hypothetical protein